MFTSQHMLERVGSTTTPKVQDDDRFDAVVNHIQAAPSGWLVSMEGMLGPLTAVAHPV